MYFLPFCWLWKLTVVSEQWSVKVLVYKKCLNQKRFTTIYTQLLFVVTRVPFVLKYRNDFDFIKPLIGYVVLFVGH